MKNKSSCEISKDAFKINPEEHINLVHACCQRFRKRGIDYDDIFQTGCMGLLKAIKNFEPDRGVKFSTYAVPAILGEIKTLFRCNTYLKIGRTMQELCAKINYEREKYIRINETEPTISQLADMLSVSEEQIIEATDVLKNPVSIDAPLSHDSENLTFEIPVEFEDEKINTKISIMNAMKDFDKKDKNLIYLRFFKGITQSEIGDKLGMTQVQVSRREKFLLHVLRKKMA